MEKTPDRGKEDSSPEVSPNRQDLRKVPTLVQYYESLQGQGPQSPSLLTPSFVHSSTENRQISSTGNCLVVGDRMIEMVQLSANTFRLKSSSVEDALEKILKDDDETSSPQDNKRRKIDYDEDLSPSMLGLNLAGPSKYRGKGNADQDITWTLSSADLPKLDLEVQSDGFKELLKFCGDLNSRLFTDPKGQSRHFGRITGPLNGECVPCGSRQQALRGQTIVPPARLLEHSRMTNLKEKKKEKEQVVTGHRRAVENFITWASNLPSELRQNPNYRYRELEQFVQQMKKTTAVDETHYLKLTKHAMNLQNFENWKLALKLELLEKPIYAAENLQKFVHTWKITREGEESHYEKCTNQKCEACPLQMDLQWIEIYNETKNRQIRITLTQLLTCKSIMVVYFGTCLLHRFLKYGGATSKFFSQRSSNTTGAFQLKITEHNNRAWTTHFHDKQKAGDNDCKTFHRMYPLCSTVRPELTYGQNIALLHANELLLIKECCPASDRFSGNTLENIFSTMSDVKSLHKDNPGKYLLKPQEMSSGKLDFSCWCCNEKPTSEAILGNHLIEAHPEKIIIKGMIETL